MNIFKPTFSLFLIVFLGYNSIAQSYNVSIQTELYESLESPEIIDAYRTDTIAGWREWGVFQVPIGFEFPFFDIISDTVYSDVNSFGGYTSLNKDEGDLYMLVHFLANFLDRGDSQLETLSPIYYKTEGNAPNQVFTLEYNNIGFFFGAVDTVSGVLLDYINIQVRLYESSGNIEFHVGPYVMQEDPETVFDGAPGPFVGILSNVDNLGRSSVGEVVSISGDINNPVVSDDPRLFMNWPIPVNTVFRFSRVTTPTHDIAIDKSKVQIFPNPFSSTLSIKNVQEFQQIEIYDISGDKIFSSGKTELDLCNLDSGIYHVKIISDDTVQFQKIVKV